jgi:DNA (cytosine-5)-methyltransferase 1
LIAGALKASLSSTQCPNEDATLIVTTDDVSLCLNGGKMARNDPDSETFIQVVRNENAKQWPAEVAPTLNAAFADKQGLEDQHALNGAGLFVSHALRGEGFDASEDGTGRGTPLVPVAFALQERAGCENPNAGPDGAGYREGAAYTLEARQTPQAVAFAMRGREGGAMPELSGDNVSALRAASGGSTRDMVATTAVRRLTPRECERLQGFPDDYTLITHRKKPSADGPRYKALGNSMAVPVMRWIGERIQMVEDMIQ